MQNVRSCLEGWERRLSWVSGLKDLIMWGGKTLSDCLVGGTDSCFRRVLNGCLDSSRCSRKMLGDVGPEPVLRDEKGLLERE